MPWRGKRQGWRLLADWFRMAVSEKDDGLKRVAAVGEGCPAGQTHEVRLVACWLGKRKGKGGACWLGENCPVEVQINC